MSTWLPFRSKRSKGDQERGKDSPGSTKKKPTQKDKTTIEPRPWLSKIERPLSGGPGICNGCNIVVGGLIRRHHSSTANNVQYTNNNPQSLAEEEEVFMHENFEQLKACSVECYSCRVFEQAFLKAQDTEADEALLLADASSDSHERRIYVRLFAEFSSGTTPSTGPENNKPDLAIQLAIGTFAGESAKTKNVQVCCTRSKQIDYIKEVQPDPNSQSVYRQAKEWLSECLTNHPQCRALRWSRSNPTRLIKIESEDTARLVSPRQEKEKLDYVALSYCWGDTGKMTEDERLSLRSGNTFTHLEQDRTININIFELPKTISDTIRFLRHVGIEYVWDEDGPDKIREMARMHEYYGNALFTLCLSSSIKATEGFLHPRKAWRWAEGDCQIAGYNIVSCDISLDTARDCSPWAKRAWTLQEEVLSPRRLYWFRQSMYWSCAQTELMEGVATPQRRRKTQTSVPLSLVSTSRNNYLLARHRDDMQAMHGGWLQAVESYARREITNTADRFPAIGGLAARYWDGKVGTDQYLAGLWSSTFAHDLMWRVVSPADATERRDKLALIPSWSWASLPTKTEIWTHPGRFGLQLQEEKSMLQLTGDSSLGFRSQAEESVLPLIGDPKLSIRSLAEESILQSIDDPRLLFRSEAEESILQSTGDPRLGIKSQAEESMLQLKSDLTGMNSCTVKLSPEEAVQQGAGTRTVNVRGRLKEFWSESSVRRQWDEVLIKQSNGIMAFDVSASSPDVAVYAIHPHDGRIVVGGSRKYEIYGHLDYVQDVARALSGSLRIFCLQLTGTAMLLLERREQASYRRVGICHADQDLPETSGYWPSFFSNVEEVGIELL